MRNQKYSVTVEDLGIRFSTGTIAKQASGAVTVELEDTTVFVAATVANQVRPDQDFFPLTVDYREKFAAAGRFPGGYFKREGRPSEKEVLTSRLCDRPLRPLFPKGFINEVQIIGYLLSTDLINEADILFVNGASAALMCSEIPWNGPIGCVRVAEVDGDFIANPNYEELFESRLDLVYVGNEKDMMMIEGSADQLSEERFVEALEFAHQKIQAIIAAQRELAKMVNKPKKTFELYTVKEEVLSCCRELVGDRLKTAVFQDAKSQREEAVAALKAEAQQAYLAKVGEANYDENQIRLAFEELQEVLYRSNILNEGKRVDNRATDELRALDCDTDLLKRVHGSSLFQRGETQALVLATLGTGRDAQELDAVTGGAQSKSFILHYNFPPFSVGETGRFMGAGRREIGHGALAERSLLPVIPPEDRFPYSIRLVSEIMESNGSTSMASICGGTLALMDAGVPILAPVAGISVGLVSETNEQGDIQKHVILTDILGAEDHFGDMDFKIAGTREGITGFQLDLKIHGLPMEIAKKAVYQNKEARMKILDVMDNHLNAPRPELKECAPRVQMVKIDPEKIGALIGPGGKNIKRITEITGAQIDINEDNSGRVLIFASSKAAMDRAVAEVELVTAEIELNKTYRGIVRSVREFGAFVECIPGKEGMVHISELAEVRIENIEDVCKVGDELVVKCIGIDDKGRVRLSRRAALCEAQGIPYEQNDRGNGGGRSSGGDRAGKRFGGDRGGERRRSSEDRGERSSRHRERAGA